MKLTPNQASAVATVRAYGHIKDPAQAWAGWMRFFNIDNASAIGALTTTQSEKIAERAPRGTDPMNVRLDRLREKGLYGIASTFCQCRHPKWESHRVPFDYVGVAPEDFAGQCALMYQLSRTVPFATLAYAFSVPYSELGERLLIGEQLELAADEVDTMARSAIRDTR